MNAQPLSAHRSERGQALVLIVLSIVGLFGFGALAVDMGQIYSARRQAQSAADSAALAAAFEVIAGSENRNTAIDTGYNMAGVNGYNNDWKTNWVEVNNPPIGGPYCGPCGDPRAMEYFQVKIKVRVRPIFAQLIYKGAEQTSVEAIAHAKSVGNLSSGDAIQSLNTELSDSLNLSGNTGVIVDGGNIRSNGGMVKNGASGNINVTNGFVYYADSFAGHKSPFSPAKPERDPSQGVDGGRAPSCPTASERGSWASGAGYQYATINGVNYYYYPSGLNVENLPKGIHCVDGGIGKGNYKGKGILIVLLSGGIKQTGNDSMDLRSATDMKDANGVQWGGMVLYVPSGNHSTIQFGGNSKAYFQGVIYAPGATCDIGGTPDQVAYHTAIICNTVKVHGNPAIKIIYNPAELFHFPPMVELVQ